MSNTNLTAKQVAELLKGLSADELRAMATQKKNEEALARSEENNCNIRLEGSKIIIEIDSTKVIGQTSGGLDKVATLGGGVLVGDITVSLTAYKKGTKKAKK